ncbi:MAG TPA: sulfite exporter TauE/SafE family protein [Steroidobacteraceae bacterium]|nr:sulfite exporter TauE/SafE family protein [Steroidobacteraceae bacterium]
MDLTKGVLAVLVLVNVAFVAGWLVAIRRHGLTGRPQLADAAIGALTTFLDTLGIGSFAPTTALLKFRGKVADELIPGTLNAGLNLSAFLETFLLISVVEVQPALLAAMVVSSAAGAWLGAGVVSRMPRRSIQLFMGVALLLAAGFFAMSNLGAFPAGGTALGLAGWKFPFAVAVSFVLGALMCVGIGNYAPLMILLSLLGMAPIAAYPIMMASDGLLQPVASLGFFRSGRFSHVASLGLSVGSLVGVPAAFSILNYVLKHDSVKPIRWLITCVVIYAAVSMLRSARRERAAARAATAVSH